MVVAKAKFPVEQSDFDPINTKIFTCWNNKSIAYLRIYAEAFARKDTLKKLTLI